MRTLIIVGLVALMGLTANGAWRENATLGDLQVTGDLTVEGDTTLVGQTLTGEVEIGDDGDTVTIDSSDWDISATGVATGLGAVTADGDITTSADVVATDYDILGSTTGTLSIVAIDGTNNLVCIVGTTTNILDADVDN